MFKKLYNWLFDACSHEWEYHNRIACYNVWDESNIPDLPAYYKIVLRCTKCGDFKTRKL